jgi:hypothetical protein
VIDFSTPAAQAALAQASAATSFSTADIQAWANIASLEDAQQLVRDYQLMGVQVGRDWLVGMLAALKVFADVAGVIVPIVGDASGLATDVKNLAATL